MKLPILLVCRESGEVRAFPSIDAATKEMEPIDVRQGQYLVYDSEGYELSVELRSVPVRYLFYGKAELETVTISDGGSTEKFNPAALHSLIVDSLLMLPSASSIDASVIKAMSLAQLITVLVIIDKS